MPMFQQFPSMNPYGFPMMPMMPSQGTHHNQQVNLQNGSFPYFPSNQSK